MSARRCPSCGARNAARAPWCTQCYAAFDGDDASAVAVRGEPAGAADEGDGHGPAGAADASGTASGAGRDVRQDEHGEVEWRCATCQGWSPLEAATCTVCGTPRRGFGEAPGVEPPDEQRTVLRSALVPGLGHMLAGRVGSGIARAVLGLGWLVGGAALLVSAARAGSGVWAALPLLAGAGAVWVLTVFDARSLARGSSHEYLDGRTLLWLVVGVTSLLVVMLTLGAWQVSG